MQEVREESIATSKDAITFTSARNHNVSEDTSAVGTGTTQSCVRKIYFGFHYSNLMPLVSSLLQSLPAVAPSRAFAPCAACLFSTSSTLGGIAAKRKAKRKRFGYIDPYRAAQARQRKAANEARQVVLERERREAMGDPIRSRPTEFINSLTSSQLTSNFDSEKSSPLMNFFVDGNQLQESLEYSRYLTEPLPPTDANKVDPEQEKERIEEHAEAHTNARRALTAIATLNNGSSKDRTRANVQRCIEEFGRHNTDAVLPPKPASRATDALLAPDAVGEDPEQLAIPKRIGPDTGSSEVQVAILTAKINVLADNLGKKDKHNKRNLRLMVHRRQKLLSYLRRQERGGPRWQNLVDKLGISDAMWKDEISL